MHLLEAAKEKIDHVSQLPPGLGAWISFFNYSHLKNEEEMTTLLQDHPAVGQAYGKYNQFYQDERFRAIDEAHQMFLHGVATDLDEARENGEP